MSTKTSIKRIALVAVSALGFGLLSVAPSNAAVQASGNITLSASATSPARTTLTSTAVTAALAENSGDTSDDVVAFRIQTPTQTFYESASAGCTTAGCANAAAKVPTSPTVLVNGSSATIAFTYATPAEADTASTGTLTIPAAMLTVVGTYTITAFTADSTEGNTQSNIETAIAATTNVKTATFTVSAPSFAASSATAANIDSATTVDTAGVKADGTSTSAEALSQGNTALATSAPGVSFTANPAITDSVATLSVPAGSVIAFSLKANAALTTADRTYLRVNNAQVGITPMIANAVNTVNWTAPATAGTYTIVFDTYISGDGVEASAGNALRSFSNAVTVTVGAASTALTDFGNSLATSGMAVTSVGATSLATSGRVGVPVAFTPTYVVKSVTGTNNPQTNAARIRYSLTLPSGAAGTILDGVTSAALASTNQTIPGRNISLGAGVTDSLNSNVTASTVYFTPATAGVYTVTLYHDADRDAIVDNGEISGTISWTIAADAQPSISFTKYGSNVTAVQSGGVASVSGADNSFLTGWGQLVKISLRNGTTPWALASNESLVLTGATGVNFIAHSSFNSAGVASYVDVVSTSNTLTLTSANFNGSGDAWVNVGATTVGGGTFSISAAITGGTANGASGSFTITTIDADNADTTVTTDYTLANSGALTNVNRGLGTAGDAASSTNAGTFKVRTGTSTSVGMTFVNGTSTYTYRQAMFTDTLGLMTGMPGARYMLNVLGPTTDTGLTSASTLRFTVVVPSTTAGLADGTQVARLVADDDSSNDEVITITTEASTPTTVGVSPVNQTTATYSIRAAKAGTNTFKAWVRDQFGNLMLGQRVTAQVTAGRNVQLLPTELVTDATGSVSFSVTDASASTLLNDDTLTFKAGASLDKIGTVTINYSSYNPVSTIDVIGGASEDVAPEVTYSLINTGTSGASASAARVKMTATLKDANGATLPAGIPVKWAISGLAGKSAILVDATTGYDWSTSMTNSNGEAITYVYAWGTGTVSVTATAGAVTSATAGKINFANAAADARVVSATVSGNVITAKVVDRYGNPVQGVSLTATRNSGVGYFSGAASSSAVGTTNANGTVDFIMAGGAANVTVATTTLNFGQTSSAAAQVNGTAITATSIGASLSPAGVQSATVDVTSSDPASIAAEAASDAALEAIDAANAATDAANLAAEAADAATVAAEEARDAADAATAAVEALASEVATLIAGLKAQITTLANTVAKIAKRVRA